MQYPEYQSYVKECQKLAQTYFNTKRMLVAYIRDVKYVPNKFSTKDYGLQINGIKMLLNMTNGHISDKNGMLLLKNLLGEDASSKVTEEMFALVRNKWNWKRSPVRGVVVAYQEDGELYVGWSLCNPLDDWNRHIGIAKAIESSQMYEEAMEAHKNAEQALQDHISQSTLENEIKELETLLTMLKLEANAGIVDPALISAVIKSETENDWHENIIPHSVHYALDLLVQKANKVYSKAVA